MPADAFDDILFPPYISLGAQTGAEFLTRVVATNSGHEYRNSAWDQPRWRGDASYGIKTQAEFDLVDAFFRARRGKGRSFRLKDWRDYRCGSLGVPGPRFYVAVGGETVVQLSKAYFDGTFYAYRVITLPVNSAVYPTDAVIPFKLYKNGVALTMGGDYTMSYANGTITFGGALTTGDLLSWEGHFHIPARFDTDTMMGKLDEYGVFSWDSIPLVELRPEEILE